MLNRGDYQILKLRNEASLCLDDLVPLVTNSTLAFDLRQFSDEVMELAPGFTFGLKQAQALKNLTESTLKQYRAHTINDTDLMSYFTQARTILKGETKTIKNEGGKFMSFLKSIFSRKEEKRQEAFNQLKLNMNEINNQISACEDEMTRCVESSKGLSRDSAKYRDNERAYVNAKNKLILLRKQQQQLEKLLDQAEKQQMITDHSKWMEGIGHTADVVLGSGEDAIRRAAEAEERGKLFGEKMEQFSGLGDSLFEEPVSEGHIADSEFGAQVTSAERRQSLLESAGVQDAFQQAAESVKSEFDSLVSGSASETKD